MFHPFKSFLAAVCLIAPGAQAHEFWIEPEAYQVPVGVPVAAALRVGQDFEGASFVYIPGRTVRFDQLIAGTLSPVEARVGDDPAYTLEAAPEGLIVVVHETRDQTLTYSELAKFEKFVTHKAFPDTMADHAARGLPDSGFKELYRRYAKTLIGVGDAVGADQAFDLRTEIVALANPYTDDLSAGFPIQVFYEGAPRVDAQVELFEKAPDGTVEITLHRTDAEGRAVLPVKSGHSYLADAVKMVPIGTTADAGPVWYSLWAALTFAVP